MSGESEPPDLQKAQTFFQYGNDAALKSNLDYAIEMYKHITGFHPHHAAGTQARQR